MKRLQLLAFYYWLKIKMSEWRRASRSVTGKCFQQNIAERSVAKAEFNSHHFTKEEKDFAILVVLIVGLLFIRSITKSSRNNSIKCVVPPSAERLLSSLLSGKNGECLIGDLQEEYEALEEQVGSVRAKIWVYKQVLTSVWPLAREASKAKLSYWLRQMTR